MRVTSADEPYVQLTTRVPEVAEAGDEHVLFEAGIPLMDFIAIAIRERARERARQRAQPSPGDTSGYRLVVWTASVLLAVLSLSAPSARSEGMPDLILDTQVLRASVVFDVQSFARDACELGPADRCVGGPGPRKLLRFDVLAVNRGTADLVVGVPPNVDPPNRGAFVFSICHDHFHFVGFARYELRERDGGTLVAAGEKRAFCIEDSRRVDPSAPATEKYCCRVACGNRQGLQVGWGDLYQRDLPCQWIDVTDVPPGDYDLCALLNPDGLLAEDPAGDMGCVPVSLSAPTAAPPHVKVRSPRAGVRLRVGHRLVVRWRRHVRGAILFQDVWYSRDRGATYDRLFTRNAPDAPTRFRTTITPDMASTTARVKVVVCERNPRFDPGAGALQCGESRSARFRVVP